MFRYTVLSTITSREKGEVLEVHCNVRFGTVSELFLVGPLRCSGSGGHCFRNCYSGSVGKAIQFTVQLEAIMSSKGELKVLRLSITVLLGNKQALNVLKTEPLDCVSELPDLFLFWYVLQGLDKT